MESTLVVDFRLTLISTEFRSKILRPLTHQLLFLASWNRAKWKSTVPKLDYFGKSKQGYYLVSKFLIPGTNLPRSNLNLSKLLPGIKKFDTR